MLSSKQLLWHFLEAVLPLGFRFVSTLDDGFPEVGDCLVAVGLKRLLPPSIHLLSLMQCNQYCSSVFTSLNTLNYCLRFCLLLQRHRSQFSLKLRIDFGCFSTSFNFHLKAFLVYQPMNNLSKIILFGLSHQSLMLTLSQNDTRKAT
jgi:hypothetical protein